MKNRLLSVTSTIVMLFGSVPVPAIAREGERGCPRAGGVLLYRMLYGDWIHPRTPNNWDGRFGLRGGPGFFFVEA